GGKLLRLSEAQIAQAIAMVVVPNNALNQTRTGHLTMWKSLAAGQAARTGVFAALLAQKGMQGPHLPFTGKHGWCNHIAGKPIALDNMSEWGGSAPFKIHHTTIKPRMACLHTLAPILAAEKVAVQIKSALRTVQRITVEVYKANERAVAAVEKTDGTVDHHWHPDSRETADHSIPYCVAATLLDGSVTTRSFDHAHLHNPELRNLLMKIELVENHDFTAAYETLPVQYRCRVTAYLDGGKQVIGETGGEQGDLSDAKTDEDIAQKFRYFTEPVFGAERVSAILDALWHLDSTNDVSTIPPLFVIE
ncbi:MAG TPA: MmgE/PrpD family protein, partial [Burkholderiales bacterium]|nr:MmgE/PrpD family protein [Burkholderiales bacterium]